VTHSRTRRRRWRRGPCRRCGPPGNSLQGTSKHAVSARRWCASPHITRALTVLAPLRAPANGTQTKRTSMLVEGTRPTRIEPDRKWYMRSERPVAMGRLLESGGESSPAVAEDPEVLAVLRAVAHQRHRMVQLALPTPSRHVQLTPTLRLGCRWTKHGPILEDINIRPTLEGSDTSRRRLACLPSRSAGRACR
jgi:hypothetical protein